MTTGPAIVPIAAAWRFCPRCGTAAENTGSNPFTCRACNYAHHFGPCAAVGAIVTRADNEVLLLIRGRDPGKGQFGIPGGFIDPGETAEDALQREVHEEVQLHITGMDYLCSFPNHYDYKGVRLPVMDVFFHVSVEGFDDMQAQEGEIAGWHFCHPGQRELDNMAFESNRRALCLFLEQQNASGRS